MSVATIKDVIIQVYYKNLNYHLIGFSLEPGVIS